jgi:hypothetical protein
MAIFPLSKHLVEHIPDRHTRMPDQLSHSYLSFTSSGTFPYWKAEDSLILSPITPKFSTGW